MTRIWKVSPGYKKEFWKKFKQDGCIAIGNWGVKGLGDLKRYSLKDELTSNIIGLVYSNSAECKYQFFKNKHSIALIHCSDSIEYLRQNFESATDDFSKMIAHLNIGNAYLIKNEIKPEPDFDYNTIQDHYEAALSIAKNKLISEFWEAKIRMYMADAPSYQAERCHNLKKAKEIFNKLNHIELVGEADELINSSDCR